MPDFTIPLNASNYVSEERQKAFQEALEDDHQVPVQEDHGRQPEPEQENRKASNPTPPQPQGRAHPVEASGRLRELIHSIEKGLEHSHAHQNRTLDVHQQFLSQQDEYAKIFSDVMEQQRSILENQNGQPLQDILQTINDSLEHFHDIQERGLEVHQQFLDQQAAYARAFVQLLHQQQQSLTAGNGEVKGELLPEMHSPTEMDDWGGPAQEPAQGQAQTPKTPGPALEDTAPEKPDVGTEAVETPEIEDEVSIEAPDTPAAEGDGSPAVSAVSITDLSETLLEIVGDKTGYPPDMLELEMDMEADLGIDSIKRVEILGALEDAYPALPQADPTELAELRTLGEIVNYMDRMADESAAISSTPEVQGQPASSDAEKPAPPHDGAPRGTEIQTSGSGKSSADVEALSGMLLEIVGEKTGYPPDMLEMDMDMEADLGIDSIKRVEILGAMEDEADDLPPFETERLAELRTLGQIVDYMVTVKGQEKGSPTEMKGEPTPKKKAPERPVEINSVNLTPLPPPDRLEFDIPQDRPIVIGDDGTDLAQQVATTLNDQGWTALICRYPSSLVAYENTPRGDHPLIRLQKGGDQAIGATLQDLRKRFGPPAGFIHLHPQHDGNDRDAERSLIKTVFFLAKHLQEDLNQRPDGGRSFFITVTQGNGQLGIENGRAFGQGSGLPGLTKTLRWEWNDVFCRAIDLDPTRPLEEKGHNLVDELFDANRQHVEVGYGPHGRVTIGQGNGPA